MDIDNAAVRSLSQRLDRLEAQVALHRLAHEYCIGADERDRDRWAAVWTPDASWETSPDRTFTGVQNICAAVQAQWDAFPIMQHATSNHVVDIEGDHASGRADVTVMVQRGDGRWIVGGATYEDAYQRESGVWRIASRRVVRPFDLAPLAPSEGAIYIDDDEVVGLPSEDADLR
ncbi:MAG: nuclear transport factor 2 family protein [Actinomycetota bacterium]|nr:nuclear transport factor 2 family protein [Actinomycetota bacterium]